MRACLLVLVTGCTVGTAEPNDWRVACGAPITVNVLPGDIVVLQDEAGEVLAHGQAASGLVRFDAPACTNSVTIVAEYYSTPTRFAMTVTDVVPGEHIDLVAGRWVSGQELPSIPIAVQIAGLENAYTVANAPSCAIDVGGKGTCWQKPELVYGFAGVYGTTDAVGYAIVPVTEDPHTGGLTATIDGWRTDFASTSIHATNAFAGSQTGASVAVHSRGQTYASRGGTVPGVVDGVPTFGDSYTIWTSAFLDSVSDRTDIAIDSFASLPAEHSVDFASVPGVELTTVDGLTSVSWHSHEAPADVTRVCGAWSGALAGWCIVVPADQRRVTFPRLPDELTPLTLPLETSVATIDTSLAASYDDVHRAPFSALSISWSGGPGVTVRASRVGFTGDPWFSF